MRVRWRVWCGLALGVGAPITAAIGCSAPSHGTASDAGVRLGPSSDGGLDPLNEGSTGIEASSVHDAEGGACHPGSLSGFHPPPSVPSTRSLACNGFNGDGGLVQAYGHACIGHAATYASCAAQSATDAATAAACFHCLVSQASPSATDYGPAVVLSVPEVNYPGCLLLLDPTEAGVSCAQAFTSEASFEAYNACFNEATTGACVSYFFNLETCMVAEMGDGGAIAGTACFGGATIEADFLSIAKLICGGG
jgi:hypothetical protein